MWAALRLLALLFSTLLAAPAPPTAALAALEEQLSLSLDKRGPARAEAVPTSTFMSFLERDMRWRGGGNDDLDEESLLRRDGVSTQPRKALTSLAVKGPDTNVLVRLAVASRDLVQWRPLGRPRFNGRAKEEEEKVVDEGKEDEQNRHNFWRAAAVGKKLGSE